jgi:hypothetical protein
MELPVHLRLDDDGLLRRECPYCEQEFKICPEYKEECEQDQYYCPICGLPSRTSEQLTKDQVNHIHDIAMNAAIDKINNVFKKVSRGTRNNKHVKFEHKEITGDAPKSQVEVLDMTKISLGCCSQIISIVSPLTYKVIYCYKCGSMNLPPEN